MIELILLTIVLAAVIAFALTHNRRANARAEADQIISGERSATEDQISEIIRTLVATKSWTRDGAGRDYYRLQQLQNIRDEVRKAKSRKYREWFRARADRIIAGEQPTRDEELDLVIDHFQLMRLMAQHKIYQDRQLLEQLLNIRNEIRKSHSLPPWAPQDPNWSYPPGHLDPNWFEVEQKSRGKTLRRFFLDVPTLFEIQRKTR